MQLDEESMNNETMDKNTIKEMLLRLGFIDVHFIQKIETEVEASTKNLLLEIWANLGGNSSGHVTLNNLRIFLLAVCGTFAEPGGLSRQD